MIKANFSGMLKGELRAYVVAHPDPVKLSRKGETFTLLTARKINDRTAQCPNNKP